MPVAVALHEEAQVATRPDEILMAAESQWLFTEEELLRAPSILDGLAPEKERENRSKGVNFIVQVGIMLKLPQVTLATASVFLHRFYMRYSMQSHANYHYYSIAATSLFLATKVEENCRKMKDLVIACVRIAQKNPSKLVDEQDKEYWKWRDNILVNEDTLLEALCFDLRLDAPYKTLYEMMILFKQEENKLLRNSAWAFINDSCYTTLCLLFSSRTIAATALYSAARHTHTTFPDSQIGTPWWKRFNIELADISRACHYMSKAYRGIPIKGAREAIFYNDSAAETEIDIQATRAQSGSQADSASGSASVLHEPDVVKSPKVVEAV